MTYKQLTGQFIQYMNNIMNNNMTNISSITNEQTLMTLNDEEHIGSSNIFSRLCKLKFKNFHMFPHYTQSQPISPDNIILSGNGTIFLSYLTKSMTYTFLLQNIGGNYMISNMMLLIV